MPVVILFIKMILVMFGAVGFAAAFAALMEQWR